MEKTYTQSEVASMLQILSDEAQRYSLMHSNDEIAKSFNQTLDDNEMNTLLSLLAAGDREKVQEFFESHTWKEFNPRRVSHKRLITKP